MLFCAATFSDGLVTTYHKSLLLHPSETLRALVHEQREPHTADVQHKAVRQLGAFVPECPAVRQTFPALCTSFCFDPSKSTTESLKATVVAWNRQCFKERLVLSDYSSKRSDRQTVSGLALATRPGSILLDPESITASPSSPEA